MLGVQPGILLQVEKGNDKLGPLLSWGANAPRVAVDTLTRMKLSFESEECELSIYSVFTRLPLLPDCDA